MAEDIQGLRQLLSRVKQLATDTRQIERPLKAAGALLVRSVERNFREQGRPQKWQKLAPLTLARRRRGRGRGGPQILINTARLKNSVGYRLVTEGVEVGTNVQYAKRHHFGYPGGSGRGRSKTPARPFLLVQQEDISAIGEIFKRHIRR
ncbi:MAG: phage virion morphogenesis protein [Pyrinomonadaceae bacterium]